MFFATPEIFSQLVNITGIFHSMTGRKNRACTSRCLIQSLRKLLKGFAWDNGIYLQCTIFRPVMIQSSRAFRSITCIIMQYNVENVISMRNILKHKRKIYLNILSFATFILFGKKSEEETKVKVR